MPADTVSSCIRRVVGNESLNNHLFFAVSALSNILVGRIGNVFWLRVEGRGSFQNSIQVKRAFQTVLDAGTQDLVVDLEHCPTMDSTFLGTLTGTAIHLLEQGSGSLCVLNANARNLQLLSELGLDQILHVDVAGTCWPEERKAVCAELSNCQERGANCKEEQTQHVLTAHKTLSNISNQNHSRFRDVIHFLEKELSGGSPSSSLSAATS
jgi:anti-anti-sigma factor